MSDRGAATPLRGAVIGGGRIGAGFSTTAAGDVLTHAAAYRTSARTELVAICDASAETADARAREWGVPGFVDVAEMLRVTAPEIVSICTPDETHAAIAEVVLAAPSVRGVLLEKPLALTLEDGARTVALAAARNVVLAVNYSRRWADGIRRTAELLRSDRLGAVRAVTGHYANGWLHNGTHWIDLARMLIGDLTAVRALRPLPSDVVDAPLDVELMFANGARGVVLGHAGVGLSFFEMDVICERGRVRLSRGADQIDVSELAPSPQYPTFVAHAAVESQSGGLGRSMLLAVEDVARCITDGAAPACTGTDALEALRVAHAARASAGDWVTLGVAS